MPSDVRTVGSGRVPNRSCTDRGTAAGGRRGGRRIRTMIVRCSSGAIANGSRTPTVWFTPSKRELEALNDADLSTWLYTNGTTWVYMRPWSIQRWRWRRALSPGNRVLSNRILHRARLRAVSCMICRDARATAHVVNGHGASMQIGHYCDSCSSVGPVGWFAVYSK